MGVEGRDRRREKERKKWKREEEIHRSTVLSFQRGERHMKMREEREK